MAAFRKLALAAAATVASACGGNDHVHGLNVTNSTIASSCHEEQAQLRHLKDGNWPLNSNVVYSNLPRFSVYDGDMPQCTECGKSTVMTAFGCADQTCESRTICATCADKKPKCGHSQPRPVSSNSTSHAPILKGASETEWTYQPSGEWDVVLCDGCMAHMMQDVLFFVHESTGIDRFAETEALVMKEHNAQVNTTTPFMTSFDSRGFGCINNSAERKVWTNTDDHAIHLCTKCHAHMENGGKAADLFKTGWRKEDEKAGKYVLAKLPTERQQRVEKIMKNAMIEAIESVDDWTLMTF